MICVILCAFRLIFIQSSSNNEGFILYLILYLILCCISFYIVFIILSLISYLYSCVFVSLLCCCCCFVCFFFFVCCGGRRPYLRIQVRMQIFEKVIKIEVPQPRDYEIRNLRKSRADSLGKIQKRYPESMFYSRNTFALESWAQCQY